MIIVSLMVSSHVLLKVKVSIKMISFPGFSSTEDSLVVKPNLSSIDMFLPSIRFSLNNYNFPKIELMVIMPLLCFTTVFFFSVFPSFSGFNPFFCSSSTCNSSLLLKKVSAWNSICPISLFWYLMTVLKGSFLLTLTSRLKFRSSKAQTFYWFRSRNNLSFLPTLDLKVFFSEKNDSE